MKQIITRDSEHRAQKNDSSNLAKHDNYTKTGINTLPNAQYASASVTSYHWVAERHYK